MKSHMKISIEWSFTQKCQVKCDPNTMCHKKCHLEWSEMRFCKIPTLLRSSKHSVSSERDTNHGIKYSSLNQTLTHTMKTDLPMVG